MHIIYVAGAYSAPTEWQRHKNKEVASEAGLAIAKMGHFPLVPHKLGDKYYGEVDESMWIDGLLNIMLRAADGVLFLPSWFDSRGSKIELQFAEEHSIPHVKMYEDGFGLEWSIRELVERIER
jgi:hypothetical protein